LDRPYSACGDRRNAYIILVRNPDGKRQVGRSRHRWVNNIKTDLRERTGKNGLD
jgi:hypothetical protein